MTSKSAKPGYLFLFSPAGLKGTPKQAPSGPWGLLSGLLDPIGPAAGSHAVRREGSIGSPAGPPWVQPRGPLSGASRGRGANRSAGLATQPFGTPIVQPLI
jgi:hypothetical protein